MNPRLKNVIIADMPNRGNGTNIPIRQVVGVFTTEGELIASSDPYSFTIEEVEKVLRDYKDEPLGVILTRLMNSYPKKTAVDIVRDQITNQ